MFDKKRFHLPMAHEPAMPVPLGGSRCSNCTLYRAQGGGPYGACASPDYRRYYGTNLIPYPPDSYCSDWYSAAGLPTNAEAWGRMRALLVRR